MGKKLLKADNIKKIYSTGRGDKTVLDGLSLTIEEGKLYAIEGESGSGKSTLLSILAGLQKPSAGQVIYNREDGKQLTISDMDDSSLSKLRRHDIVYVPQMQEVLPNLTVRDNICLVDYFEKGKSKSEVRGKDNEKDSVKETSDIRRLTLILEQLGISDILEEYPSELSGGELRRLCIARTLYANPKVILADEPTNDLDRDNCDKLRKIFCDSRDKGVAVVVVTHDSELAHEADERIQLYIVQGYT